MASFRFLFLCASFHLLPFLLRITPLIAHSAVTYEQPGGRLGDQLIAYMHAKWIAYRYNVPLLYKPFPYSKDLILDRDEILYDGRVEKSYSQTIFVNDLHMIDAAIDQQTLFVIPYFPESPWDLKSMKWPAITVDWEDRQFIALLKSVICPKQPVPMIDLPADRITIAAHVRRGGGFDTEQFHWPLKFPSDHFFITQIRKIYEMTDHLPLWVYIFTDDPDPEGIAKEYREALSDIDVVFGYRSQGNHYNANVLTDLFNMMQFDCLIRPDSNFSIIAEKLGNFKMVVCPLNYIRKNQENLITETKVIVKGVFDKELFHLGMW